MILQALVDYYETLLAREEISPPGWGLSKVTFALELGADGSIIQLHSLLTEQLAGKKTVILPRTLTVPMPVKRTVGVLPNFLCDNAGYILGADGKGNARRTQECFDACKELHLRILEQAACPAASAVKSYFSSWQPQNGAEHPALKESWDALMGGGNIVLWYDGRPVYEDAAVHDAWQHAYLDTDGSEPQRCLVTGELCTIPSTHPSIKNVQGAQSSGAALISFNADAFCSYGKTQNLNAPVGEYAAFAYTTALNHLLADRAHRQLVGDTTVVCWAKSGEEAYQDMMMMGMMGNADDEEQQSLVRAALKKVAHGEPCPWDNALLHPDTQFYVLGLAPNAARISVRFFLQNSFGAMMENLNRFYENLEVIRPAFDKFETMPLWRILSETVNQNARDKAPSPQMAGDVLRAILTGGRLPATLLNGVMLRIRAEHNVTRGRAAIIKAYYLRNENKLCPKEVLTVDLQEEARNVPYLLGRLFSVLEAIQQAANPGINTTIKDKYINSAAATPSTIFPILLNLAQKHLKKLPAGQCIYWDKQLGELSCALGETLPTRMPLPEQGSFYLGYYMQAQKRFTKKEEN